ncbi:hypothetical protein [Vibrio hepatarius]|uniref:hypothetical protein n=1 Tax=Vibrio hepatarius TaxID=171383 RepID=UPI003734F2A6
MTKAIEIKLSFVLKVFNDVLSLMRYLILLVLSLIFSASGNALTINITVKGDKVRYENSRDRGAGSFVATTSEIFSSLEPTNKWIPAILKVDKDVVLIGPSSEQVNLQVLVNGLEYDWGSLNHSTVINANLGLEADYCSQTKTSSTITITTNSLQSCIASKALVSNKNAGNIPFYFVRPVFEVKDLLDALKGKSEGVYIGSVKVPFRYYYYNSMSILTYKNLLLNLTFKVNYIPEVFTSLVVIPENGGVMSPQYSYGKVKGETRFNIEVLGYFNAGIKMKIDTSKGYYLNHESQMDRNIPYYVRCDICEDKIIVGDNGKVTSSVLNNSGVVLVPVGSDKTKISYSLTVGYSDKTVHDVSTGTYSDSFVVIFGLDY